MTDAPVLQKPRTRRRLRKIDAAMRRRIEAAVETMIATLDALDAPEEDREEDDPGGEEGGPSDDEPTLGWTEMEARFGRYDATPTDEGEPSLGWTAQEAAHGRYGNTTDLEDEHDGREPSEDDELTGDEEPSLGAAEPLEPERGAGSLWLGKWTRLTKEEREAVYNQVNSYGSDDDREGDDAEHENARTDPAKLAKARERREHQRADVSSPGGDGRLVYVGPGSNVRPPTAEERRRLFGPGSAAPHRDRRGLK